MVHQPRADVDPSQFEGPIPLPQGRQRLTSADRERHFADLASLPQRAQRGRESGPAIAQAARIANIGGGQKQDVEWKIKNKKGNTRIETLPAGKVPKTKRNERLLTMRGGGFKDDGHLSMGDASFNLLQALGAPPLTAGHARQGVTTGLMFHEEWNNHANANYGNDTGITYHLASGPVPRPSRPSRATAPRPRWPSRWASSWATTVPRPRRCSAPMRARAPTSTGASSAPRATCPRART